jgi:beta-glucanase (GH16 family)
VTNPTGQLHTYSIDWSKDRVQWLIDGAVIRTLTYAEAKGGSTYPQTPMQIKFGTWVAGRKDAPKGTVDWAGGYANFANAPFDAYYKDIKIVDYAGGVTGARQYIYSDRSGTWQSIKVDTEGGSDPAQSSSSSSATAAPSSSSSASGSQSTLSTSTVSASNAKRPCRTWTTRQRKPTADGNATTNREVPRLIKYVGTSLRRLVFPSTDCIDPVAMGCGVRMGAARLLMT